MIKDIISQNENTNANDFTLRKLHADFPQCFDKDGKFNMERFKKLVSDNVEVTRESYELNFLGKNYAHLIASTETETVIQPDVENNNKPENKDSQNVYISGDNIDALKHLLKSYSGKIKCIYIDPPYNTGSDGFVYNDKFGFTSEQLQVKLDIDEDRANRILDLCKRGSASHSAWLTYMSPRLMLAKDLLTDDGVIFISIDNNEQANLKLLCDGIFGEENFIEVFLWTKTSTPPSLSTKTRKTTEYVLCYEKHRSEYKYKGELLDGGDQPLLNSGNAERILTFPKEKVFFSSNKMRGNIKPYKSDKVELLNEIHVGQNGYSDVDIQLKGEFKWQDDFLKKEIEEGTTFIIKSETLSIRFIRQGEGWKRPTNYIKIKEGYRDTIIDKNNNGVKTNESASDDLFSLFGKRIFSFPKPISLIKYLINFIIEPNDIVLDFFSGSGTTGESVFYHNMENNSTIHWILVQLPENLDENLLSADVETKPIIKNSICLLDEINKPHLLDEIGQERIRRAAAKIRKEHPDYNGDLGFKHYILKDVPQDTLDKMEHFDPNNTEMFSDTDILQAFGKDTVLETWCVRDGYGLNAPVKELKLENYTAYYCGNHLYFIDGEGFDENAMAALIDEYNKEASFSPQNIILFGYNFTFIQTEMIKRNITILDLMNKPVIFDIRY